MPAPVRTARPTFRINGEERARLGEALMEMSIREGWDGLRTAQVTFGNWGDQGGTADFLFNDRAVLDFGKELEVRYDDAVVFKGRIYALEADYGEGVPPTLGVHADDALQDLRMTRRTRTFADVSDADLLDQVAQAHGLRTDVSVSGPTYKQVAQVNQSDLALLRDRALLGGFELWIADDTLHAAPRADRAGETVTLRRGEGLQAFHVTADLAHQATALVVSGWDVAEKAMASHEATDSVLGRELGNDESGAALLQRARGERKQTVAHTLARSADEAQAQAEGLFKRGARRFVVGEGKAPGDARLTVGRAVKLEGLGTIFDGTYTLVEVDQRFDAAGGLRTEFTVERPGIGRKA